MPEYYSLAVLLGTLHSSPLRNPGEKTISQSKI
jgi:hypothetical protein